MNLDKSQMVARLNMASQKTAELLGLDDVMTKTTVGSHKTSFGIFMEKAPGVDADSWRLSADSLKVPEGQLSPSQIKELPNDKYAKVVGGIMRKTNRLEWFDLITGQSDRHGGNYFIAVYDKDYSVTQKGIDNDAGFPPYRKSLCTFELDEDHAMKFRHRLASAFMKMVDRRRAQEYTNELFYNDTGITHNDDGTIIVNTRELKHPLLIVALRETVGIQTVALPEYIDEDLYNHLVELEKPGEKRDNFIAELSAQLLPDAVDATVKRLDEVIKLAKDMKSKGKVVSEADWLKPDMQRTVAGKIPNLNGVPDRKIPKVYEDDPDFYKGEEQKLAAEAEYTMTDYFRRDIVRTIAKPGWFDEEEIVKAPSPSNLDGTHESIE